MKESRRYFMQGLSAIGAGALLLGIGAADKIFRFFFGPRLSSSEEAELMSCKLKRLESTLDQRKLELERETSEMIMVSPLSDLNDSSGKYFIDYKMSPAMAFSGKDGLPILLSAKCTHLGCTVGNQVNNEGKVLCPCHVSYFDIVTGKPNADAPAKAPLPHIPWVVMDDKNNRLASRTKDGTTIGSVPENLKATAKVFIAKGDAQS